MNNYLASPAIEIILAVLTLCSFVFSMMETAVIGINKIRLRHLLNKGSKRAKHVQRLLTKMDRFIAAILIGNNFVNIAISAIITAKCVNGFGYKWGVLFSTLISATLILVLCELTPKILATKHAEKIALNGAPAMEVLIMLLSPVIPVFIGLSNMILRILRIPPSKRSPLITEEELRTMIEVGKEEGVLSDEERKMLHRIFEFGDIRVHEVMIPREKMVAINVTITPEELLNTFVEEGHARLPVFKDSPDNIIGIIYARDLLYILRDKGLFLLEDLVHAAYYVSSTTKVSELLKKFQADKIQIAIVVDSEHKAKGLVTLEDLMEEIVGEIEESASRGRKKKAG